LGAENHPDIERPAGSERFGRKEGAPVRTTPVIALLGLVALSIPNTGSAQLQLSPSIGLYVPHGSTLVSLPATSDLSSTTQKKAVGGPVFTTRMAAWLTPHLGIEGSLAYSPSLIAIQNSGGDVRDVRQGLILASMRSIVRMNPPLFQGVNLHFASGVGMVSRGGAAWADTPLDGPALAIALAFGGQTRLGHKNSQNPVFFRFELEDYISWMDFADSLNTQPPARVYHDLIWSLGIGIPISR
jgi:hypothetical protein